MLLDNYTAPWLEESLKSDFKGLVDFIDSLFEPRFSVSQMGISRQELLYWRKQEVMHFDSKNEDKRTWVKVNFFEYCLIRLVAQLRNMNVPLESIKAGIQKLTIADTDQFNNFLARGAAVIDDVQLDPMLMELDLKAHVISPIPEMLDGFKKYFAPFNLVVISMMFYENSTNLLINSKGNIFLLAPESAREFSNEEIDFLNQPYVSIPLRSVLNDFYTNPKIRNADTQKIFKLTRREASILELLKKEGFKEVKIRLNKQRKGELIIELTEQKKIPSDEARIKSLLKKGKYQNIKLQTENGHIVLYEETTKFKI